MADPVNTDIERAFSMIVGPLTIADDNSALIVNSRDTCTRARGQMFVVTTSIGGGGVTLPGLWNNEAPPVMIIVNESANTIRIGCSAPAGSAVSIDTINGVATPQAMTSGTGTVNLITKSSMICFASQSPYGKRGGPTASLNNWHAVVVTV